MSENFSLIFFIKNRDKTFEKVSDLITEINKEDLSLLNMLLNIQRKYQRNNPYKSTNFKYNENGELICSNNRKFHFKFEKHVKGNNYGCTEEIYECESCERCHHKLECCPKAKFNRTIRINRELTSIICCAQK